MFQLLFAIIVGSFAGTMTGLMGASGVMAVVPGMILLGYTAHQAIGTSLAVDMTASLVVALSYYRNGRVNLRQGIWIALAAVLGAQVGSHFSLNVPEIGLSSGFGICLIASGILIWKNGAASNLINLERFGLAEWVKNHSLGVSLGVGLWSGVYCGLFGAGGGMLFLFILLLLGYSLHQAIGTSTLIMALTTASGTVGYAMLGNLPYLAIAGVTGGTVVGSFASARIANRINERQLSRVMAVVLAGLGITLLIVRLPR